MAVVVGMAVSLAGGDMKALIAPPAKAHSIDVDHFFRSGTGGAGVLEDGVP